MLEIENVSFGYRGQHVLENFSLAVPEGELRAVIGPNGAGKSTLFGVMSGEHIPTRGHVRIGGRNVTRMAPYERARLGIVQAFQVARFFADLSVRDNVRIAVLARRRKDHAFWQGAMSPAVDREVDEVLEDLHLAPLASRESRSLSQGDKKRLEIAMALALKAKLLLLDEPTAGMSPHETEATVDLIRTIWQRGGLTLILTEHDMQVVFSLAQQVTVLVAGELLCTGSPEEIRVRDDVRQAYLGRADA